jgi:hypothetical protein
MEAEEIAKRRRQRSASPSPPPPATPSVPSGPPEATTPSEPPDDADPFEILDAVDPLDDYCDGLASRTFRSLAEVKRAHARCDHLHRAAPLSDSDVPEGMKGLW